MLLDARTQLVPSPLEARGGRWASSASTRHAESDDGRVARLFRQVWVQVAPLVLWRSSFFHRNAVGHGPAVPAVRRSTCQEILTRGSIALDREMIAPDLLRDNGLGKRAPSRSTGTENRR